MHSTILCLSTSKEYGYAALPKEDDDVLIGADYIGNNEPERAEDVINNMFGNIAKFNQLEVDEDEYEEGDPIGELQIDQSLALEKIEYRWNCVKNCVNESPEIDPKNIFSFNNKVKAIKEFLGTEFRFRSVVNFDGEYLSPFEFLCRYMLSYSNSEIYVINCVDFHW